MLVQLNYGNLDTTTVVDDSHNLFDIAVLSNITDNIIGTIVGKCPFIDYCKIYITPILDHVLNETFDTTYAWLKLVTDNYITELKVHNSILTRQKLYGLKPQSLHKQFYTEYGRRAVIVVNPQGQHPELSFKISYRVNDEIVSFNLPHPKAIFQAVNFGDIYATINEGLIKSYLPIYCKTTILPILERMLLKHRCYSCSLIIKYQHYMVNLKIFKRHRGIASLTGRTCSKYKVHLKHQFHSAKHYVGGVIVKEFL